MPVPGPRAALLAALLLAACGNAAPGQDAGGAAAPLPADIVRALQTDERVLDCPGAMAAGGFAADWVRVRRVDLDGQGAVDWLVEGVHPCLRRDGLADWWLYADDGAQRRLLQAIRDARAVRVLGAPAGPAVLRVETASGASVLRFDHAGSGGPARGPR